jgi:phenylacetate-CoA ligase
VELAEGVAADNSLAGEIRDRLREVLVVGTSIELVPWASLNRTEHKSQLVER